MANYSLVVNSKFRPFELDEMLKPVMAAEQAHKEIETAYGDLATKANIWDKLTNAETDKISHKLYSDYSDALKQEVDELTKNGLSLTSRQALSNLRGRYAKEIIPIETAYKKREEERKRQREAMDRSGGNMIFSRDAATTSLDNYLNDIEDYSQVNLDNVLKYGMAAGKSISDRNTHTKEGRLFNGDYFDLITTKGYTPKQAIDILRNTGKYPEFSKFINDELTKIGISEGSNLYSALDTDRIKSALYEGLNMGITYDRKDSPLANWRVQKDLDAYYDMLKNTPPPQPVLNAKIAIGASGEADPDIERLGGLRKTVVDGAVIPQTDLVTKYKKEVDDYTQQLEAFKSTHGDLTPYEKRYEATSDGSTTKGQGSYTAVGKAMSDNLNNPAPKDFATYQKIKKALDKAKSNLSAEGEYLKGIIKSNSAYGRDKYEILATTQAIKKAKSVQQDYVQTLNMTGSIYNDLTSSIYRNLSIPGFNLKDVNTGKIVDKEDAKAILTTKDNMDANVALGVIHKRGKTFIGLHDAEGNAYEITGMKSLDDFNSKITSIDRRLGDWNPRTTGNIITISGNGEIDANTVLRQAANKGKLGQEKSNGIIYCTAKIGNTNTLYNIVKDVKTGNVYIQSLEDELYNQGKNREQIIANLCDGALGDMRYLLVNSPKNLNEK